MQIRNWIVINSRFNQSQTTYVNAVRITNRGCTLTPSNICAVLTKNEETQKTGLSDTLCCATDGCNIHVTPTIPSITTTPIPTMPLVCYNCPSCGFLNIGAPQTCPLGYACCVSELKLYKVHIFKYWINSI